MNSVRMGIIGVGNMGSAHAVNIVKGKVPNMVLTAVADINETRREWAQKNLPNDIKIFESGDQLIESGICDAVLVAVPHYQHPTLSIKALKAGQHVMCEKPAGVYTQAVREMNEAASASDRVFAMMFNQRTNCVYRKMHDIVHSGEMGQIKRVNWIITDWYRTQSYYDSGAWRATWAGEGGGVLLNQCPHNLDLIQWICGMPSRVQAFLHYGKWHNIEVEDDVTAYLEYPNGATGVFITTTADLPGTNRFEITLEHGKLVCEQGKLMKYDIGVSEREWCNTAKGGFDVPKCTVTEVETDGLNPQHNGVLTAFAANILEGKPLIARGEEGIHGLELSNAMHLSDWLGRAVELPLDEYTFLTELNKRRETSRHKDGPAVYFDTSGTY